MTRSTVRFYDSLAEDYHLVFEDWDRSIERQAEALTAVIRARAPSAERVLDCTCGIGTQALGFVAAGFHVTGSDLSLASLRRAAAEAARRGLTLSLFVCDVRRPAVSGESFDVVAALDNSLCHLTREGDLETAVRGMARACGQSGLVLTSVRDYAPAIEERRVVDPPRVWGESGARRMTFQIWTWLDERRYHLLHLVGTENAEGEWHFRTRETSCRAVLPEELAGMFASSGLEAVEVLEPSKTGYYQPLIVGSKG